MNRDVIYVVCEKPEADRISIFCQGNELFQINTADFDEVA